MPDIAKKRDDGTYYFAKSVKQEPSNTKSIMQDIVLEPQEAENYIKHANTKPYNKEMSDKIRADGGSIQSPQFPQGAKTLENPELKNFSSASDIIPQANERFQALNDKYNVESFLAQRENISAKDSQYPNKRVSKGGLNQEGDIYVKPTYERNPNFEFSITKKDVKDLRNGKITDELINKLENDLTHPHYEESFLRKQEPKEQVFTNEFGEQVDKNGNYLFAKGGDNLLAGVASSIEEDENGNISFNPTKFALGFGGYSALKGLATNKRVREFAKDGVNNLANKAHLQALNEPKYINGFQKEQRGIYNVTFNDKFATYIKQDLDNIDNALRYAKGNQDKGAKHIEIRHLLDESKQGYVTKAELLNVGKNIREFIKKLKEPFVDKKGARIYEWQDEKGNRFRVVADNKNRRNDTTSELPQPAVSNEIITFYSDRNIKNKMPFENPEVRKFYLPTLRSSADNVKQKSITTNEKALKEQQSVGRKLYATHRTDMQGLEKMLESNSLPAPSYAISKSAKTSEKFGDIIIVPKERQIDPKNDAFVYGGDAWTPRYSDLSGDAYSINKQSSFLKNPNIKEALKKANDKDDFIIHLENDESLAKVIETQALKLEKQGSDEPWDEAVKRISDDIFIKQEPTLDNKLKYLQEQVKANGNEIRGLESGITPEYVHSYKRLNDLDEIKLRGEELKSFRNQDKFYQEASKNLLQGKQAPASYMEAKRLDKVSFDEVSRIIVPDDKFEQVSKLVKDKGLNVKVVKQGKNESANLPTLRKNADNVKQKHYYKRESIKRTTERGQVRKSSDNKSNYIYAKGGDNLAAGLISGVEEDENGNLSINPTKFIIGLGEYTVAKKLLQNPKVQAELKDAIAQQLYRLELKAQSGDMLAQNILGTNYLFTNPNLPNGKYTKGAFSDTATKQVMGEIDDRGAKLILKSNEKRANLGDILSHKKLFKKYPEFKNIDTHIKIDKNAKISGKYEPKTNQIEIVAKDKNEAKTTLLHEIQHAIQTKENWARGGSIDEFKLSHDSKTYYDTIEKLRQERQPAVKILSDKHDKGKINDEQFIKMVEELPESKLIDELTQRALNSIDPKGSYKKLHGEQMARATEYRANMSSYERLKESYTDTLKRVEGEAPEPIVKYGDGKALSYETKRKYTNLRTGKLLENELRKDAELLPRPLNKKEFIAQFSTTGWAKVKTPLGDVQLEVFKTWKHIADNTYHENRTNISGAFVKTLQDPLIIVHNPQKSNLNIMLHLKMEKIHCI